MAKVSDNIIWRIPNAECWRLTMLIANECISCTNLHRAKWFWIILVFPFAQWLNESNSRILTKRERTHGPHHWNMQTIIIIIKRRGKKLMMTMWIVNIQIHNATQEQNKKQRRKNVSFAVQFSITEPRAEREDCTAEFKWENLLGGWKWTIANGNCKQNIKSTNEMNKINKIGKICSVFVCLSFVVSLCASC